MKRNVSENIAGYLFIMPVVLGILIFTAAPILMSLYYSFTSFDNITAPVWLGGMNYVNMFKDEVVWQSLKVTFVYALITVAGSLILSFFIGLLVNVKVRFMKVYRVLIYLPVIIPGVAMAALWKEVFNSTYIGFANRFFDLFGLGPFRWFASEKTALMTLMLLSLWGLGGGMLIWIAGFNSINPSYYEAATIDGAGSFRKMVSITLPIMSPIIFYNLVMSIISSLQVFSQAFLISGSGPYNSTYFFALLIYNTGIGQLNMGYACAMAWLLFTCILILIFTVFKTSGWVFYGDGSEGKKGGAW